MSLDVTVTDLFCGAGGSSIGAEAMGARLKMAANHWDLAIETHATNFPDADHDCADVSQVDPRRYPRTDILLASPECTHHSSARSKKHRPDLFDPAGDPAAQRSRATMWDVPRFAEHHRYQVVIVENVVEIMRWAPLDGWFLAMERLGYRSRVVSLNSAVCPPTPQSRDRIYVVFWRKGNPAPDLDFRVPAWCAAHGRVEAAQSWKKPDRPWGKYRQQYVYLCPECAETAIPFAWPAAAAIDWTMDAPRIGDRKRPLAKATVRRIQAGLERYGPAAIVQAAGNTYERPGSGYFRTWPITHPLGTQTTTVQHALVVALRRNGKAEPAGDSPLPTVAAGGNHHGLLVPPGFVLVNRTHNRPRGLDEPLAPMCTGDHQAVVAIPAFYVKNFGPAEQAGQMAKPVSDPLGTVTSVDHHSLVTMPFLTDYHGMGGARPIVDPLPTQDTRDRFALVEPAVEIDDCGFRMLAPHEIGLAMAFPEDYVVHGNKRDRVKQYGNAVTPPAMTELLARSVESLVVAA